LVSATGNTSYAHLSVNTNLTGQLRSRNQPLDEVLALHGKERFWGHTLSQNMQLQIACCHL